MFKKLWMRRIFQVLQLNNQSFAHGLTDVMSDE